MTSRRSFGWLAVLVSLGMAPAIARAQTEPALEQPSHLSLGISALELGTGAAAAVISVPAAIALGELIGHASPNLYVSGLPSLLLLAVLPPVAVTVAEWLVGNHVRPGSARLSPTVWLTFGVQVATLLVAGLLGAWLGDLPTAAVFTLVEALLLPGAATASNYLFAHPAPQPVSTRLPPAPAAPIFAVRF